MWYVWLMWVCKFIKYKEGVLEENVMVILRKCYYDSC